MKNRYYLEIDYEKIDKRIVILIIVAFLLTSLVFAVEECGYIEPPYYAKLRWVKAVLTLIQFFVPLGLFIVGLFNLILAKLKKNKDIIKKAFKNFIFNIVIGIIVFFMVLLINVGLDYYQDSQDDGNFRDCWHEGTVDINTNN